MKEVNDSEDMLAFKKHREETLVGLGMQARYTTDDPYKRMMMKANLTPARIPSANYTNLSTKSNTYVQIINKLKRQHMKQEIISKQVKNLRFPHLGMPMVPQDVWEGRA